VVGFGAIRLGTPVGGSLAITTYRVPDAAQRFFSVAPQSRDPLAAKMDPGSAAHRYALHCIRGTSESVCRLSVYNRVASLIVPKTSKHSPSCSITPNQV
jgi:hypothetical protein